MRHAQRKIRITLIALLLVYPGAAAFAQQPASSRGLLLASSCGGVAPTTPQFNNTPAQPTTVPSQAPVPVSPVDPVPGSTAVGGTVNANPNAGLTPGCTGQVYSATGC
jgi:hypothetical protein